MVHVEFVDSRTIARTVVSICPISPFYPKTINVIAKMNVDLSYFSTHFRFVFKE